MWLQKLCIVRQPDAAGVYTITADMTLQQISELLFMHITTITKLFAALEEEGIVHRTRHQLQVLDLDRLRAYCDECAAPVADRCEQYTRI
jgi:CRP/FNR family cyclic AMP-dependent transcriptional regulator